MILELVLGHCHDVNNKGVVFKLTRRLKGANPDIPEYKYMHSKIIMRKWSKEINKRVLLVESITVPQYGNTRK